VGGPGGRNAQNKKGTRKTVSLYARDVFRFHLAFKYLHRKNLGQRILNAKRVSRLAPGQSFNKEAPCEKWPCISATVPPLGERHAHARSPRCANACQGHGFGHSLRSSWTVPRQTLTRRNSSVDAMSVLLELDGDWLFRLLSSTTDGETSEFQFL